MQHVKITTLLKLSNVKKLPGRHIMIILTEKKMRAEKLTLAIQRNSNKLLKRLILKNPDKFKEASKKAYSENPGKFKEAPYSENQDKFKEVS